MSMTALNPAAARSPAACRDAAPSMARFAPGADGAMAACLRAMLDEVDLGLIQVDADLRVLHANRAAWQQLAHSASALRAGGGRLAACWPEDQLRLMAAVDEAVHRSRRSLLQLHGSDSANEPAGSGDAPMALVPLSAVERGGASTALLLLGRQCVNQALSLHWHAKAWGLTAAEARVLEGLCAGASPRAIALSQGVALSTVRTQIVTLRVKTGAANIRALVNQVAKLPPVRSAV